MKTAILTLLVLFFTAPVFSQDQSVRSVELPSFVITGEEKLDLPAAAKLPPPFIPVISNEYLKPNYQPDQLDAFLINDRTGTKTKLTAPAEQFRHLATLKSGNYALPGIAYTGLFPIDNIAISTALAANYKRPYVVNSGHYDISPSASAAYKINDPVSFFDQSAISFRAAYNFSAYKLYALPTALNRKLHTVQTAITLESMRSREWILDAGADLGHLRFSTSKASATKLAFNLKAGYEKHQYEFVPSIKAERFAGTTGTGKYNSLYIASLTAPFRINMWESTSFIGGMIFTGSTGYNAYHPFFTVNWEFSKGIVFTIGYKPGYEVFDLQQTLQNNRFAGTDSCKPLLFAKRNNIEFGISYEFRRLLDFTVHIKSFESPDFPAFVYDSTSQTFRILPYEMKGFSAVLGLKVYPGEYGYFLSDLTIRSFRTTANNFLANAPWYDGCIEYGYMFPFDISAKWGVRYRGGQYADAANQIEMDSFVSFFAEAGYTVARDFLFTLTINNLLNKKNYLWYGYQETPFEITGGISYRW